MDNNVILFKLKSTLDLHKRDIEDLGNDFKSIVGSDNYTISTIFGPCDTIEFGVKT